MMRALTALLERDLRVARRRSADSLLSLLFFVVALSLFPFGVGAAPDVLARIGAGIIWVLALLAVLVGLDRLWQADLDEGSLEQLLLSPAPLELLVMLRTLSHWLTTCLPLVLVSPLLTILMNLPAEAAIVLPVTLLLGTPTLALIGGIGAALLLGARRGGALVGLLVLPLEIPVLIFGVSAIEGELLGLGGRAAMLILAAMLAAALALAPFAQAAALRLAME